ncbi:alpha-galactosidase [Kribbella orskensis]|uniref:Alpha-galactosidase n=1 Tax=Kribbella orskensis TaxID=2512216 RepID=A0ABY2BDC9_9ACTN|nr:MULTISPECIES: glycoside hydrolase family 36 protein [Kribbella]TCN35517.1 alpha-galactosidase [Kribbella sp. VKM Ac-2500]TCO17059.1 alpha-galactosidase [Kribbella orskensis]
MTTFEIRSPDGRTVRTASVTGARSITELTGTQPGVLRYDVVADDAVRIRWTWPAESAVTLWRATQGSHRELPTDWGSHRDIRSVRSAPVAALVDAGDRSPLTISLSATVRGCDFAVGVNEEGAEQLVQLAVDDIEPTDGVRRFTLRIDLRELHFAEALRGVTDDWTAELGNRIAPVPEPARQAMYSTWYSDHQHVSAESVERHARAGASYGCSAVIVDDGWQTDDTARGYAHCGDWEPTSQTFPDMAGHVRRVHELGVDYVLWIAPPLIGEHSKAWDRMKDRTLGYVDGLSASVLDPRYPEVREHIVESCVRPVRDWGVDGLKLDFLDTWAWSSPHPAPDGDCSSIDEGVELILHAITAELRRLRPDLLIEFRQDYVNPRLWQFGTFLRAGDCAMDPVENRVRTIDSRLLAGDRAVHSDMLMWHPSASPETVAQQFIGAMFSTPQVSMELVALPVVQQRVVRFWLGFLRDHADALLHGVLTPSRPDARYTQVRAAGAETVVAVFTNPVVRLSNSDRSVVLVNGGSEPRILVEGAGPGPVDLVVSDCSGAEVHRSTTAPTELWAIDVPVAGLARIERK